MEPLHSKDPYIYENGSRTTLGELFDGSEHDISELEEAVETLQEGFAIIEPLCLQNAENIQDIKPMISGPANEYRSNIPYTAGTIVIHDNKVYVCNTSCSAGAWSANSQYFTETNLTTQANSLRSEIGTVAGDVSDLGGSVSNLSNTVSGHTTDIGSLQTFTGALQDQINPDAYSDESAYTAGDYVIHGNALYKCNTSCTADTWANNSQYFTATNIADELSTLNSNLTNYMVVANQASAEIASLASGANTTIKVTCPVKAGYKPILGIYNSNNTARTILPFRITGSPDVNNEIEVGVINTGANTATNIKVTVSVIYIRDI